MDIDIFKDDELNEKFSNKQISVTWHNNTPYFNSMDCVDILEFCEENSIGIKYINCINNLDDKYYCSDYESNWERNIFWKEFVTQSINGAKKFIMGNNMGKYVEILFLLEHNHFELVIADVIKSIPMELDLDAVGLWQIIPFDEKYDLNENEYRIFLYKTIISLMQNGAVPVVGGGSEYEWKEIDTFGKTAEDVANNISVRWTKDKKNKMTDNIFDLGGVWFARPIVGKKYVRLLNIE
jgi:hypothetical protein